MTFENGVSADVAKLRWGHSGLRWALNPTSLVVLRDTETHRTPCEGGDRLEWSVWKSKNAKYWWLDDCYQKLGFPGDSDSEQSVCNAGDPGSIPGLGRSPGEGNGYPLQYSCLEKLGEVKERTFSRAFGRRMGNLTPWLQISNLQNCRKIDACCLKPLSQFLETSY